MYASGYTKLSEETPLIRGEADASSFLSDLKTNRRYVEIYIEEKKKELFQDVFSTPSGTKTLKTDVDTVVKGIKEYSLTHRACRFRFYVSQEGYGFIKQLAKIKNTIDNDTRLSGNPKIVTGWKEFLKSHMIVFCMAVSQKTGLIPRAERDFEKYEDGCYLEDEGEDRYALYYWW